ncbi:UDP-N-acetylenolpyruvoylglucosamine reductase [Bibersteinia trehalosi USDA-ARS-USMARC-190]|uniref:Inner membrane protein n=1 Tax=Bibersteinia trehalosi USDA-ARS-USMARC-190 TaxID=1263832 RepID=W0R3R2_BIBTR|nr:YbaN family protein [Bibersteinia trehalosi]AHG85376.1 UDP-N-acetylenolpyruvoylglucosamine reductase [Bibersteinia trehalosi USDA-ARS-USMARC-190]
MKPIYIILGFIAVALGLIGIPTPGLPTTPFLLLAMYFFGKGSPRVQHWFMGTKLYKKYLKEYDEKRAMTMKQKLSILLVSAPFSIFAFFVLPNIWGKIVLALVIAYQYYYFLFKIKTLEKLA